MKRAYVTSTATGYDVIVTRTRPARRRHYTNIKAASLRRFYRLTGGFMDYAAPERPQFPPRRQLYAGWDD